MEISGRQSRQKTDSQRTRLAEAISNGRLYQTKMILVDVTNLNYLDSERLSPLMRAFMIDDSKHRTRSAMVKLLLHHKADVNLREDRYGRHVLNWACKMNKLDLVKLVLEKCLQDVDLTSQDLEGNTPLLYAVINNNAHMVKLLVSALKKFSLSVDHRNRQDKTAYLKALEMGFDECASILSQVGMASRNIKVNPFLDFLAIPSVESFKKIRVRSAPLQEIRYIAKECGSIRQELKDSKDSSRNKKRGSRLLRSRKIHSVVSRNGLRKEDHQTHPKKGFKRENTETAKAKPTANYQNVKIFVEKEAIDSTSKRVDVVSKHIQKKDSETSRKETNPVIPVGDKEDLKDGLLRILLDESQSRSTSGPQSPRSSLSSNSCNQVVRSQSKSISPTSKAMTSTVNSYVTGYQAFRESNEARQKEFPNYHSYLVWKASLDHSPNTLRSFLALRAEQHSETSSYRKGIVIPKYDPTLEDSLNDLSGGAISPVSERSIKSEAGRKISAVAKTVGLSIYLTNKRKNSYRKES